MNILQFLFGKGLSKKDVAIKPGTFYLDVETNELFFDDPSNSSAQHNKVVDTATLIYKVTETITFPSDGSDFDDSTSSQSAVLGVTILGSMTLGTE